MSKIRYQLIPTNVPTIQENSSPKWIVYVFISCLLTFAIIFYTCDPADNQLESTTVVIPRTFRVTHDLPVETSTQEPLRSSSSPSSDIQETSTYSSTKVVQITEQSTLSAIIVNGNGSSSTREQPEDITIPSTLEYISEETTPSMKYSLETESGVKYFVNSPQCQMLHPDPFAKNVLKIYHIHNYVVCDKSADMITVNYNWTDSTYSLHKNEKNSTCCYKQILRAGARTGADQHYRLMKCIEFGQDFVVPADVEAIITECRRPQQTKVQQSDAFSFVHPRKDSTPVSPGKRQPSVLLWGIDSVSRMNFQRTMPLMFKYLGDQHWFDLQGYNKMGDNTFPNLMAVLTGFNKTYALSRCRPNEVGGLDACPLVWKDFKAKGYTTAFGEDWSRFSTFDYMIRGFRKPPTDVYARPLVLAAEKELKSTFHSGIPYCLGRKSAGEYIYDLGLEFTKVNRNRTFFGMFWTNTYSHNDFSMPSAMDGKMVEYMRTMDKNGVMDNTVIIFFSDHGSRFGPLRKLDSGFLEERLPFIYIRLPRWIREKYPHFVRNLQANRNRLTSPYDIHATLRHLLELDSPPEQLPPPAGCATCHSVFQEVAWSRNCSQAGIDEHWCGCDSFTPIPSTDPLAQNISQQLVASINEFVAGKKGAEKCHRLKPGNISSIQHRSNSNAYLIQLHAQPGNAFFEATAKWDAGNQRISISVPSISRLDSYASQSKCSSVKETKKFCIC
ncbi:hypothetical protein KR009_005686 [Drosophila setifemur]|nr:hypothetical protein KR009_005686 [Drosophila setifemur]